jgi:hypothetical protein
MATPQPRVQIVTPSTTLFVQPIVNIGDLVTISGIATGHVTLTIESDAYDITPVDGLWSYVWNTSSTLPNLLYHITAICDSAIDSLDILTMDTIPPRITIMSPSPGAIVDRGVMMISGGSRDNDRIDYVEVRVDNDTWVTTNGIFSWYYPYNLSGFSLGDHILSAKAIDAQGTVTIQSIPFVINESGHEWGPEINTLYSTPTDPTNTSNVIIYANVSTTSPFKTDHVSLYCDNGTSTTTYGLYRYGDFPVQGRHEEDPLRNLSNAPLYGCELGQFPTGTNISYWIVAVDTAQNSLTSEIYTITIG